MSGSNGEIKAVRFFSDGMFQTKNGNWCSVSSKPSLIPVSGLRGRFSGVNKVYYGQCESGEHRMNKVFTGPGRQRKSSQLLLRIILS